jgi:hypothetical protein
MTPCLLCLDKGMPGISNLRVQSIRMYAIDTVVYSSRRQFQGQAFMTLVQLMIPPDPVLSRLPSATAN